MDDLLCARKRIDEIDCELARLVSERLALARRIGALKRRSNKRVLDTSREKQVRKNWRANAKSAGLPVRAAMRVLRGLLAVSRAEQEKVIQ